MSETQKLFVARESDVAALREHLDAAISGSGRAVTIQAPLGSGKRAVVGELLRSVGDQDIVTVRASLIEEEDGIRTVLRLFAALYSTLHRDKLLSSRVELMLNTQMPSRPKRVQQWYQAFIEGMKKSAPKPGEDKFQVTMPRDNPGLGFVEILSGIAAKATVVVEIQNAHASQSVLVHAMLEALSLAAPNLKLLVVMAMEPRDENADWFPQPLADLLDRRGEQLHALSLEPWGADEAASYLASKGWTGDAAALAALGQGRPGFIAELADMFESDGALREIPADATLASLWPREVDADELSDDAPAEGRTRAGAEDMEAVAYRAALLGRAFPSGLLADIGGYDRDSVDDLLDAADGLFEEMQFSEPLQTWIYQFKHAVYHQGALAAVEDDAAKEIATKTAQFMERFLVPRGYDFLIKTSRLYARAGQSRAAQRLRAAALGADRPEAWLMAHDVVTYFKSVDWPDPMRRAIFTNVIDRMVAGGDVNQADQLYNQGMTWAQEREDRRMQAWLLYAGSRLDLRRQDYYRARDRARDALKLYEALELQVSAAELHNHLASIEYADGNTNAALEQVEQALQKGQVQTDEGPRLLPQIAARAEFTRGLIRKRERKFQEAAQHFGRANEIAGRTGNAGVALDSGLALGESLLLGGEGTQAADVLTRVVQISRTLKNPVGERTASSLLSQAHGSLKNFDAAGQWAGRTLELTRQLKFNKMLPFDTYNVGFFQLMQKRPTEALALFRQARQSANLQQNANFAKELLFNTGMAALQVGERAEAKGAFTAAIPAAAAANDHRKVMGANEALADLALAAGERDAAATHLRAAVAAAEAASLKEERRKLRRKLEEVGA